MEDADEIVRLDRLDNDESLLSVEPLDNVEAVLAEDGVLDDSEDKVLEDDELV